MRRLFSIGEALIDFIPNVTNANLKMFKHLRSKLVARHAM